MTVLYFFKELTNILFIYAIAFILYYCILVGLKSGFNNISNLLYKITNFIFPILIIIMLFFSIYIMLQQISVGIALISLSLSICNYFVKTSNKLSKDNLFYYSNKIKQLDEIMDKKLITQEEYDQQIEILKTDFEKNKNKILK